VQQTKQTKGRRRPAPNCRTIVPGVRTHRVPIERELRPLLERLVAQRDNATGKHKGRLLWLPDHEDRAVLLREHLHLADVTRTDLFTTDSSRRAISFHDLRATGITWAAVRGDDPLRIKQRAGHKAFSTTEIYIREAENLRAGFGTPFPPLPADLLGASASVSAFRRRPTRGTANFPWYAVEQRGIEHTPTGAPIVVDRRVNDAKEATKDDERRREVSASYDVVEVALAKAIQAEVTERSTGWEARVALLAAELRARRLTREGVLVLGEKRRQRGP
jgi:hypothetical protein